MGKRSKAKKKQQSESSDYDSDGSDESNISSSSSGESETQEKWLLCLPNWLHPLLRCFGAKRSCSEGSKARRSRRSDDDSDDDDDDDDDDDETGESSDEWVTDNGSEEGEEEAADSEPEEEGRRRPRNKINLAEVRILDTYNEFPDQHFPLHEAAPAVAPIYMDAPMSDTSEVGRITGRKLVKNLVKKNPNASK